MKIPILLIFGLAVISPPVHASPADDSAAIAAAIDAVPSYRIYQVQQHASSIDWQCRHTGASVCRTIHRFSNDPGAAAREVEQAMHSFCDTRNGLYDAAADLTRAGATGMSPPQGIFEIAHVCRTGRWMRAIGVHVDDYGSGVDRQSHDPVTRLLGDKRSRYEAVTSVIGYMLPDVVINLDNFQRMQAARCHQTQLGDLHEGVITTAGLLVEVRSRVALVQPDHGPSIWVPIDRLQLAGPRPGCDDKPAAP